ncbi:hypothetical protein TrLO_g100 [Triparma laevis f. longispina]|uniref:Uncharacterized protein n=1 Tax=Triparma laevis f. longispina TaxID=1714387 RepID=A0A9W7CG28_9STRA|nr:hypothetical protein TrLO_g100 [Triparma laevis f. longispina]
MTTVTQLFVDPTMMNTEMSILPSLPLQYVQGSCFGGIAVAALALLLSFKENEGIWKQGSREGFSKRDIQMLDPLSLLFYVLVTTLLPTNIPNGGMLKLSMIATIILTSNIITTNKIITELSITLTLYSIFISQRSILTNNFRVEKSIDGGKRLFYLGVVAAYWVCYVLTRNHDLIKGLYTFQV